MFTNKKTKFVNNSSPQGYETSAWWDSMSSPRNMHTQSHQSPSKYQQQSCTPPEQIQQNTIQQKESPKKVEPVKALQKAIRMDIDFNRIVSPEPQLKPQLFKSKVYKNLLILIF